MSSSLAHNYVIVSKKHLACIDHGVKAARHEARKQNRLNVTYADVMVGFSNTVLPTDQNLARAAQAAETRAKGRRQSHSKVYAVPLQDVPQTISKPVPERESVEMLVTSPDRTKRSTASLSKA